MNREGNVVLKLKTPWRNGATHIVMTPMEFMQRLAALVPRPRLALDPLSWSAGAECEVTIQGGAGAGAEGNSGRG